MEIVYSHNRIPAAEQVIELFDKAKMPRPTGDKERIQKMIDNADLVGTAWAAEKLVGIVRIITDWCWCAYLSDLAVDPHKTAIFSLCISADHIELKWHLAQLLPRIPVSEKEFMWVWNCLAAWAINTKESRIVRANSFEGLFILLKTRIEMKPDFEKMLTKIIDENIPSLNARIKKLKLHYHL